MAGNGLRGEVRKNPQQHAETGAVRQKKPNRERLGLHYWWRRRELNPRPPALDHWLYMLRVRLLI